MPSDRPLESLTNQVTERMFIEDTPRRRYCGGGPKMAS